MAGWRTRTVSSTFMIFLIFAVGILWFLNSLASSASLHCRGEKWSESEARDRQRWLEGGCGVRVAHLLVPEMRELLPQDVGGCHRICSECERRLRFFCP